MSEIVIKSLEVHARVGVTDEERAEPQRLLIDLVITTDMGFSEMSDRLGSTIDYVEVVARVDKVVAARPRKLIETLAADIGEALISGFVANRVFVEVKKFILPRTDYVSVRCEKLTTRRY
jgi:dihydroneopterin aldolase